MSESQGPSGVFRVLEARVANPILRVLLRTPIARLGGGGLVLLSYRGRRSGRRIRTPVMAVEDGEDRVVTTYREGVTWWRNFRDGHDAVLWIRGEAVPVHGRATTDESDVADWLREMRDRGNGRLLQFFGLPADPEESAIKLAAEDVVFVRFSPR